MSEISGIAKEIERKYLLTEFPPFLRENYTQRYNIHHGWLPGEIIQERLTWNSRNGGEFWRTIKSGKGIERIEAQEQITADLFYRLWSAIENFEGSTQIRKIRYTFLMPDKLLWEIDEFENPKLNHLILAEIEIPSKETEIVFPEWLAPYIKLEVTEDPNYLNINLAKRL